MTHKAGGTRTTIPLKGVVVTNKNNQKQNNQGLWVQLVLVDILLLLSDYHLSCPKNCHVRVLYTTRFAVITRFNIMSINCVPLGVLWMSWRQRSAFSTVVLIKRCVGLIAASTWFSPCEASIADHP